MAAPAALQRSVVAPAGRHTASLIFLHGSGDTGQGARTWIKQILNQDMAFQHIKVIYPTAPARPYTPMKGALSTVWFDRYKISNDCPEHIETIDSMCRGLTDLINDEIKNGISKNRILVGHFLYSAEMLIQACWSLPPVVTCIPKAFGKRRRKLLLSLKHDCSDEEFCRLQAGINYTRQIQSILILRHIGGFSMGGGMAMHLAYRFHRDVAGVFALSSFLNRESAVYQALTRNDGVLPELFQCHGTADELVRCSWGEETNKMLKSLGVSTSFHTFPELNHELNQTEIEKLKTWIVKKLPIEDK